MQNVRVHKMVKIKLQLTFTIIALFMCNYAYSMGGEIYIVYAAIFFPLFLALLIYMINSLFKRKFKIRSTLIRYTSFCLLYSIITFYISDTEINERITTQIIILTILLAMPISQYVYLYKKQ